MKWSGILLCVAINDRQGYLWNVSEIPKGDLAYLNMI